MSSSETYLNDSTGVPRFSLTVLIILSIRSNGMIKSDFSGILRVKLAVASGLLVKSKTLYHLLFQTDNLAAFI